MGLEPDGIVQVLLRERVRVTASAAAVVRDAHAADDVFQQVVLAALEHRAAIRDSGHLLAWALRAARHRALDVARARKLRPLPDDVLDQLEAKWAEGAASDQVDALHKCTGRLGDAARELLRLRYTEGLTAVAVAARLNRSADAVYQSLSRLHRSLRECVERELGRPTAEPHGGES